MQTVQSVVVSKLSAPVYIKTAYELRPDRPLRWVQRFAYGCSTS